MNPNIMYKIGVSILEEHGRLHMEAWARSCARAVPGIGLRAAREATRKYRRSFMRRVNANGMSVYPLADGDEVAGILSGPFTGKPTVTIVRVDDQDDPNFIQYMRHLVESGSAMQQRAGTDLGAAIRRGQLTTETAALFLGNSTGILMLGESTDDSAS